jgi:hypothetical protein
MPYKTRKHPSLGLWHHQHTSHLKDPQRQETPQQPLKNHRSEQPQGNHQEADSSKTTTSRETVIRVSRLYVEVSLVFDFIVWEYFYVFLII